jgi:hypothetical protein
MSHKKKNKNQTKTSKKQTQCALDTTIRKKTQITLIRQSTGGKEQTNHRLYAEITTRNPKRKDT